MSLHLYLSPHFDDAVLSCGGLIAQQTASGQRVIIATLCAGAPPIEHDLSPFAQSLHERWLTHFPGQDLIALRRQEDRAACARVGAEARHLDGLDCIYRRGPAGEWLYTSHEALFDVLHPGDDDPALTAQLHDLLAQVQPQRVYAPLAVGNHVDHQWLRRLAETWAGAGRPLRFYEDYPYGERVERLAQALNQPVAWRWLRHPQPLTPAQAEAKIAAIACYGSQMTALFESAEAMPSRVQAHLSRRGAPGQAEILWQPLIQS